MSLISEIAQAVWEHPSRTLASGTPDAPNSPETNYAKAIWEYSTRNLTSSTVSGSYVRTMPWGNQKPPLGYQLDRSSPFAQGLVGCWLFNEQSGAIANDLVNRNNGVCVGNANFGHGNLNIGVDVDKVEIQKKLNATIYPEISFEFVFVPRWVNTDGATHILFDTDLDLASRTVFFKNATNDLKLTIASVDDIITATYPIVANKEYHVCITTPSNKLYINNALVTDGTNRTLGLGANKLCIGGRYADSAGNSSADSVFKYFRLYNKELTAAEISYLYANPYAMIEGYNFNRVFSISSGITFIGFNQSYPFIFRLSSGSNTNFKTDAIPAIITATSTDTRLLGVNRTTNALITPASVAARQLGVNRSSSAKVTTNTSTSRLSSLYRNISARVVSNATVTRLTNIFRSVSARITSNSTLNRIVNRFRSVSARITNNSTVNRVYNALRNVSAKITNNSVVDFIKAGIHAFTEYCYAAITTNTSITDFTTALRNYVRNAVSSISTLATTTRTLSSAWGESLGITVGTTSDRLAGYYRTASSSITSNTLINRLVSTVRSASASIQANAYNSRIINLIKRVSSVIQSQMSVNRTSNFTRQLKSSISLTLSEFDTWVQYVRNLIRNAVATVSTTASNTRRIALSKVVSINIHTNAAAKTSYFVRKLIVRFNRLFGRGIGPD